LLGAARRERISVLKFGTWYGTSRRVEVISKKTAQSEFALELQLLA
jgi:hypothetical protein